MTGSREPPRLTAQARRAAKKARLQRERDEERARIAELRKSGAFKIVTQRPQAKAQPRKPRPSRALKIYRLSLRDWRRFLVLSYIAQGPYRVRDISRALGVDPTSVAQSICELKRLGLLPSQIGRTPIRRQT